MVVLGLPSLPPTLNLLVDLLHGWMAQGFWDTWSHSVFPLQYEKDSEKSLPLSGVCPQNLGICSWQSISLLHLPLRPSGIPTVPEADEPRKLLNQRVQVTFSNQAYWASC